RNTYDPYGKAVSLPSWQGAPVPVSYGFTGARWEESTGLYLMHHRWYDPATGRFIEQDPIGESGGLNVYAYVGASPTMKTDPSGLRERSRLPPILGSRSSLTRIDAGINSPVAGFYVNGVRVTQRAFLWMARSVEMGNQAHATRIARDASELAGKMLARAEELGAQTESMSGEDARDARVLIDQLTRMAEQLESVADAGRFGAEALKYETLKKDPCSGYTYSTCITVTETVNSAARDYWNRVKSFRELKETYGWKPGDSMIISKYRPLDPFKERNYMFLRSYESSAGLAHEQVIWLRADGAVDNRGYGPTGL
ncbi:MAG: RHS repeat-associated core domain-containing protein, partial [Acidobacteriota bacterium]|nr:RHS repeat-associated core domain-containing protein [Acidobacteriota bacterium]